MTRTILEKRSRRLVQVQKLPLLSCPLVDLQTSTILARTFWKGYQRLNQIHYPESLVPHPASTNPPSFNKERRMASKLITKLPISSQRRYENAFLQELQQAIGGFSCIDLRSGLSERHDWKWVGVGEGGSRPGSEFS
jgi:hypothetical protein